YAAPEFFEGRTSRHSDQYSLAITYCQLRGGQLPFTGTPAQMMAGHLMQTPDLEMLPAEERLPVARALAKDPAERWPSCRAFVEALFATVRTTAFLSPSALAGLPTVPTGDQPRASSEGATVSSPPPAAWPAQPLVTDPSPAPSQTQPPDENGVARDVTA